MERMTGPTTPLPTEGRFPSLEGATEWLNTPPLSPGDLRGRVVVVDFCTYTCINWLRTLPYVRAWAEKYRDYGVVVIGVHTPEFSFEHELENVRRALKELNVEYPIAVDNDYAIWDAFSNNYWPALYFIDAQGNIRHHRFGEGDYEGSETVIQQLLTEAGVDGVPADLVAVDPVGPEAEADWDDLRSPETYLGYERTRNFASPGGMQPGRHSYVAPESMPLNDWALSGDWTATNDRRPAERPERSHLVPVPRARRASRNGPGGWCDIRRIPGVDRQRATARRIGRRRGRRWSRPAHRAADVPARPATRIGRRPPVRDRVSRPRRGGVRVHVRLISALQVGAGRPLHDSVPYRLTHSERRSRVRTVR